MAANIRRALLYWAVQLAGWTLYAAVFGLSLWLGGKYTEGHGWALLITVLIGLVVSHALRAMLLRQRLTERPMGLALPRLALVALSLGAAAALVQVLLHDLLFRAAEPILGGPAAGIVELVISWTILLLGWGICYFAWHWFVRGRREEIRSLRLESANREGQLANLRAQLNPHFMFNALNGIRALIDEDPARAKLAITQLSSILRNAMATVKRPTVPLGEELDIVKAYLELERMRFEERLRTRFEVEAGLEREPVPPMLLQTLVENAVRHGIARLTEGGEVVVAAHRVMSGIVLSVRNSGVYTPGQVNGSGIGLAGTRKRLAMIYGEGAGLHITNRDGMVVTEVELPSGKAQDTSFK
jgi:hypothetical protein